MLIKDNLQIGHPYRGRDRKSRLRKQKYRTKYIIFNIFSLKMPKKILNLFFKRVQMPHFYNKGNFEMVFHKNHLIERNIGDQNLQEADELLSKRFNI